MTVVLTSVRACFSWMTWRGSWSEEYLEKVGEVTVCTSLSRDVWDFQSLSSYSALLVSCSAFLIIYQPYFRKSLKNTVFISLFIRMIVLKRCQLHL